MQHRSAASLRVVTYNLHSFVGTDGHYSPERIASVLSQVNADIVALQEVEQRSYKDGAVTDYLQKMLGMPMIASALQDRSGFDYGNALFARPQPERTAVHDLSFPGREPRAAIEASFLVADVPLRIVTSHFGLARRERRAQLRQMLTLLANDSTSCTVLCADFNEWMPFAAMHRALGRELEGGQAVRTFPARFAVLSLDRIYVRPAAACHDVRAIETPLTRVASDHLPVVADLLLETRK